MDSGTQIYQITLKKAIAPLENWDTDTMTQYSTQSHYPITKETIPCAILEMSSASLDSNTYKFSKSLV